jgi:hypothetical protein
MFFFSERDGLRPCGATSGQESPTDARSGSLSFLFVFVRAHANSWFNLGPSWSVLIKFLWVMNAEVS